VPAPSARQGGGTRAEGGAIVSGQIMFLVCPAYMDRDGAVRCGLPAEVSCRFIMNSTDGPLESVMIRCPSGHCFNGPIEFLAFEEAARAAGQNQAQPQPPDHSGNAVSGRPSAASIGDTAGLSPGR